MSLETVHIASVYDAIISSSKTGIPKKMMADATSHTLKIYSYDKQPTEKKEYSTEIIKKKYSECEKINNLLLNSLLDCDKIEGKLVLRTKCQGDSIRLLNRGCTKTLSKLFCENKVDVPDRDNIPVIADDKGVVWVYGFGVAQRCAVSSKTETVYFVKTIVKEKCNKTMSNNTEC